jgi:hypothetical protein
VSEVPDYDEGVMLAVLEAVRQRMRDSYVDYEYVRRCG